MRVRPWDIKVIKFTNPQDPREDPKIKEIADKNVVLIRICNDGGNPTFIIEGIEGRREQASNDIREFLKRANSDEFKK